MVAQYLFYALVMVLHSPLGQNYIDYMKQECIWTGWELSASKVSFLSFNSRAIDLTTSFLGYCPISILLIHFLACVYVIYSTPIWD